MVELEVRAQSIENILLIIVERARSYAKFRAILIYVLAVSGRAGSESAVKIGVSNINCSVTVTDRIIASGISNKKCHVIRIVEFDI